MAQQNPQRRFMSRFELATLAVALIVILIIGARQGGCKLVSRTEQIQWIE